MDKTQQTYQDISIGVKVSEDLIKSTVAVHVAKQLEGSTEALMTKMIIAILNFKKDSYSSTPTMMEQICMQNLKPLIEAEAEKYFQEMSKDIARMIQDAFKKNMTKDKVLKHIQTSVAEFAAKSIKLAVY